MTKLNAICAATVLALSLSIPAYADGTNPGEVHDPGKAQCVTEIPTEGEDSGSTTLTTTIDSDFSLYAIVDVLWTVASVL